MRNARRLQRRVGRDVRQRQHGGRTGHPLDTFIHIRQPMVSIADTLEILVVQIRHSRRPQPLTFIRIPIQRSQTDVIRLRPSAYLYNSNITPTKQKERKNKNNVLRNEKIKISGRRWGGYKIKKANGSGATKA
jgi:hypothetical protein